MRNQLIFLKGLMRHWGALVTGGFLVGVLGIWQATGHSVSPWIYWTIAIGSFIVSAYRVWLEALNSETDGGHFAPAEDVSTADPNTRANAQKSNVRCLGCRLIKVGLLSANGRSYGWREREVGAPALVLDFRNEPEAGKIILDFESAAAHIRFISESGDEVASVAASSWLQRKSDRVTLEVGRTESVVVLVELAAGWQAFETRWKSIRTTMGRAPLRLFEIEERTIPQDATKAVVTLIDGQNLGTAPVALSLDLEAKQFSLSGR